MLPEALEISSEKFLTPDDAQSAAQILKLASEERRAIIPIGGCTQIELGAPPTRADLLLSLAKLNRVLDYQPANLTVCTEAGIALGALNKTLAQGGQFLPIDPPLPERATIGGILASNSSGPLRHRYGTARDLLIGIRVALTNGEIVRGGGQVVKNVAGYDLPKLFVGSLGTLGVIVEATFKLAPLPGKTRTVVAYFPDAAAVNQVALRVLRSSLLPLSLDQTNPFASHQLGLDRSFALLARFAGLEAALLRQCEDVANWASEKGGSAGVIEADESLWARARDFSAANPVIAQVSVLPSDVGDTITAAEALAAETGASCSALAHAVGIIQIALEGEEQVLIETLEKLRASTMQRRGHLVVHRGPRSLRERIDVWGETRSELEVMRKLKNEFDPAGVLNPGRFVGGL